MHPDPTATATGPLARRTFISTALKAAGAAAFMSLPASLIAGIRQKTYTVQQVIDIILKEIPGAPFRETVDTLKSGSPSQQVTGIVTTMFATIAVIEAAAKRNANFIIAHEPTFYNHQDDTGWVADNEVVRKKQALLKRHNIAVWRFHDYWHTHRPDGVRYGVLEKTGWLQYYKPEEAVIRIPAASLQDIVNTLKQSLGIDHLRVIGDLSQSCERIALMPGAAGGQRQVAVVEKEHPDVLIVGEVHEWETAEYIRDTRQLGGKTALVVLGHSVSEEPGMEWLVQWLQPKVPGLTITHIPSDSPFTWS
jgi:putative NIF3 family GTP cyclohydrolase 1 type 2